MVCSHTPLPSVVQPPRSLEAIPIQEEELPPPQLPVENKGERSPFPHHEPTTILLMSV